LTESTPKTATAPLGLDQSPPVYDRGNLTYSGTFDSPFKRGVIKTIEWCSGKIHIIRMIRKFEKRSKVHGHGFWRAVLDVMGIDLMTPQDQLDLIPKTGPVVVVANHPHGLVDGLIMAELIGCARPDYRILTRAFLTGLDKDAAQYLIPVPFPHEKDAQAKMVEMRKQAMAHLKEGGVIALFPSGVVASSNSMFGPMVEEEWNLFTAKMIRTSGARVVPLFFPGANSRWYQMANQISATLRQSLLIHEIVNACGKPQKPIVGVPFDDAEVKERLKDPRACMAWMRDVTLNLKD
jgi:putative hemolysin